MPTAARERSPAALAKVRDAQACVALPCPAVVGPPPDRDRNMTDAQYEQACAAHAAKKSERDIAMAKRKKAQLVLRHHAAPSALPV